MNVTLWKMLSWIDLHVYDLIEVYIDNTEKFVLFIYNRYITCILYRVAGMIIQQAILPTVLTEIDWIYLTILRSLLNHDTYKPCILEVMNLP